MSDIGKVWKPSQEDKMTKGIHVMHSVAERHAISIGPRLTNANGIERAAYYLTKKELRDLFRKHGFNTNGVAWLNMIVGWKETWEEVTPSPAVLLDKEEEWRIYFVHPNQTDLTTLKMFAEDHQVPILAVEA